MRSLAPLLLSISIAGCAASKPLLVHRDDLVLSEVDARYHSFYPTAGDPDLQDDVGLLRPRFGLPAIAQTGSAFDVELLERGAPGQVRGALLAPTVTGAEAERCL